VIGLNSDHPGQILRGAGQLPGDVRLAAYEATHVGWEVTLDVAALNGRQAMQEHGQDGAHRVGGVRRVAARGQRALFEGSASGGKRMDGPTGGWPRIARQQADVKVRFKLFDAGYAGHMRLDRACIGRAGDIAVEQDGPPLDQDVHVREVEAPFEWSERRSDAVRQDLGGHVELGVAVRAFVLEVGQTPVPLGSRSAGHSMNVYADGPLTSLQERSDGIDGRVHRASEFGELRWGHEGHCRHRWG
jgi:hypothetical protein